MIINIIDILILLFTQSIGVSHTGSTRSTMNTGNTSVGDPDKSDYYYYRYNNFIVYSIGVICSRSTTVDPDKGG